MNVFYIIVYKKKAQPRQSLHLFCLSSYFCEDGGACPYLC